MPIITIQLAQGRTTEQKQAMAEAITQDAVRILNIEPEWVTVLFQEYPRDSWATGGTLHSIKYGPGHGKEGVK